MDQEQSLEIMQTMLHGSVCTLARNDVVVVQR